MSKDVEKAINVLHVIHYPKSGIGALVREMIRLGDQQKFQYHVVILLSDADSEAAFQLAGAGVTVLDGVLSLAKGIKILLSLIHAADIVHVHSFLPQALIALTGRQPRVIRTVHNSYPYYSSKKLWPTAKRSLETTAMLRSQCYVVCVSEEAEKALPIFWKKRLQLRVIHNGVSIPEKYRNGEDQISSRFILISLGRLEDQKGLDILLSAVGQIKMNRADIFRELSLWFIGAGGKRIELERNARDLQVDYKFWGHVNDPHRYLIQADVFVMPSRYEGFPLAAAEALSSGLPTITSKAGGLAKLLEHMVNGYLLEKNTAVELAAAICYMYDHPHERKKIAAAGRKFAENHLSIDCCIRQYESLYVNMAKRTNVELR